GLGGLEAGGAVDAVEPVPASARRCGAECALEPGLLARCLRRRRGADGARAGRDGNRLVDRDAQRRQTVRTSDQLSRLMVLSRQLRSTDVASKVFHRAGRSPYSLVI